MTRDFKAASADIYAVLEEYRASFRESTDDPEARLLELITRMSACIERWAPPNSAYREPLRLTYELRRASSLRVKLTALHGSLSALGGDFDKGRMVSTVELIHGELFSDYLDMAKDAAAVIAGSTLEAHLRALCTRHGLPTAGADGKPKKASVMNTELRTAGAYDLGEVKQVDAWLDIRNDAAHGDYTKYDHARVANMIGGIRGFIVRLPA
jgi:hypothetical protein